MEFGSLKQGLEFSNQGLLTALSTKNVNNPQRAKRLSLKTGMTAGQSNAVRELSDKILGHWSVLHEI